MTEKAKLRLRKLAHILKNRVKDDWFDMTKWAEEGFIEKKCGTSACAAGWAVSTMPELGLRFAPHKYYGDGTSSGMVDIAHGRLRDFKACARAFDIDVTTAEHLFDPDNYPQDDNGDVHRLDVVKRLRGIANTGKYDDCWDGECKVTEYKAR